MRVRCLLFYNTGLQLERDDLRVAQLPHLATPIPLSASPLHLVPNLYFGKTHTHSHNRVIRKTRRWRVPLALGNDQLHSLEPLLLLRIITIAHTDETVAILRQQLLRAFLARFEMQARAHTGATLSQYPPCLCNLSSIGDLRPSLASHAIEHTAPTPV